MQCETLVDFLGKAKEFFLEDPYETLFKMKYSPCNQRVTFAVRLNSKHASYTTQSQEEAKKADVINSAFIQLAACPKIDAATIDLMFQQPEEAAEEKKAPANAPKHKKV